VVPWNRFLGSLKVKKFGLSTCGDPKLFCGQSFKPVTGIKSSTQAWMSWSSWLIVQVLNMTD
jgi:hypothetical protein